MRGAGITAHRPTGRARAIVTRRWRQSLWAAMIGAGCALIALVSPSVASAAPVSAAPGSVVISSQATSIGVGRVLVNSAGFSLYDFTGDGFSSMLGCLPTNTGPGGVTCTGVWIPVMATGPLVARGGVIQSRLGHINRPGIGQQVTYFGHPLYTFVADTAPGQVLGEDVTSFMGFWRLMSVGGQPAADRATVNLELSSNGPVLATPTTQRLPAPLPNHRSLYVLSADPPGRSTCTGECAAIWPPLLTNRQPVAGAGADQSAFGVLRRGDGTLQVTYNHKPLYLFAFDLGAGAPSGLTNGENFVDPLAFGVWDTVSPSGLPNPGAITVGTESSAAGPILATPAPALGGTTATIYSFSADTATTSNCVGQCALFWPPMLTSEPPVAGPGADSSKLGTIQRPDGSFQITYNGQPLYLFSHALDPTTAGNGITAFGGTFQVVSP
jgi:predicted lipoprotein with Yx(FWY)xxD motif